MARFSRRCVLLLLVAAIGATPGGAAYAAGAILDTGGFESYNPGPLTNLNPHPWLGIAHNGTQTNVNKAVVQGDNKQSGLQAVKVERAGGIDNYWAVQFTSGPVLPSHRFLLIDWDMWVEGTGWEDGRLGPFFGIDAYDAIAGIGRLGSLGVDATTSEVLYLPPDPAPLSPIAINANDKVKVQLETWNHFAMLIDFSTNKYSGFLNGSRIIESAFSDPGVNQFTDADIVALASAADPGSKALIGLSYFDNLRVLDGVPADFDFDGDVDGIDLGIWRGGSGSTNAGDADGDTDTDGSDFMIWQQNLGADFTPAAAAAAQTVPEPAASVIASAAVLGALARRRRRAG